MMNYKDYLPIIFSVLIDWRVIVTVVAMIFVMVFANYVVRYRKKMDYMAKTKYVSNNTPTEKKSAAPEQTEDETL